jgi:malate dehydrogenase
VSWNAAVNAALDTVKSLITPTPAGDWHSVAVCSDGSYGIEKGLSASMPIRTLANGKWEVVQGLPIDAFSQEKIDLTISELKEVSPITSKCTTCDHFKVHHFGRVFF